MREVSGTKLWLAVAITVFFAQGVHGRVRPNSLFSENAVLQQGMSVPVWGTAADGERVTVSIQGQNVSTTAKSGRWMVRLQPLKEGGPYEMTINDITIRNILVGEVWLASGQSNMVWWLHLSDGGAEAIESSTDPMLRLLTVPREPSKRPVEDVEVSWLESAPDTAPDFSAVAYHFGRDLRESLGCPVGLISSNVGATRIEAWTAQDRVEVIPAYAQLLKQTGNENNMPSVLYNGMIAPLIPYAIRGTIWYQGEANAVQAQHYRKSFPALIQSWREKWDQGAFPFLFVQLAPYSATKNRADMGFCRSPWAELREAQRLVSQTVPKTAMVVITDCGDPNGIHPKWKKPVGERLALAARAMVYGESVAWQGPAFRSMSIRGSRVIVEFDHIEGGLVAKDGEIKGFAVAGADREFYPARASIVRDRVVVSSDQIAEPEAVRYGWASCPVVNLFNKAGLPTSPFRTDDWPMVTAEASKTD